MKIQYRRICDCTKEWKAILIHTASGQVGQGVLQNIVDTLIAAVTPASHSDCSAIDTGDKRVELQQ